MKTRILLMSCFGVVLLLAACDSSSPTTTEPSPAGERHSVLTHCGWYETVYDDIVWTPVNIARGAFPEGTGSIGTDGTVIRDGDRLVFTADSGLVVIFGIAPPDLEPPPPCD